MLDQGRPDLRAGSWRCPHSVEGLKVPFDSLSSGPERLSSDHRALWRLPHLAFVVTTWWARSYRKIVVIPFHRPERLWKAMRTFRTCVQ